MEQKITINETIDGLPVDVAMKRNASSVTDSDNNGVASVEIKKMKSDHYIWGIYCLLIIVSIVELYSASSTEVVAGSIYGPLLGHLKWLLLGFFTIWALQKVHYAWFRFVAYGFAFLTLAAGVAVMFVGVNINGAQRALSIAGQTVQPAEFMKLSMVVLLARIMAKNQMSGGITDKGILISLFWILVYCGVVIKNGFTNTFIILGVSTCMFVISGMKWKKLGLLILFYCALGAGGYIFLQISGEQKTDEFSAMEMSSSSNDDKFRTKTRENRVDSWMKGVHPGDTITDKNYQPMHSHFAMARGRISGNGPGNSREAARLPLAFSDYIYSIIVEDTGFIGGALLLIVYLLLVGRAGRVASKCSRAFPALLIMGCAVLIVFQALVHMAIVTGLGPVSGQPLPFISKGGTSIWVMSMALGMMLSVSRFAVRSGDKKEIKRELSQLPEDMHTANPMQMSQ